MKTPVTHSHSALVFAWEYHVIAVVIINHISHS